MADLKRISIFASSGRGKIAAILAAFACLIAQGSATASTVTGTMAVTALVSDGCLVTPNAMAFGAYNPLSGSPNDASTTLVVQCTTGTAYVVSLDAGLGSGATVSARKMTSGANTITYSLYRDAARTQVWGQTAGTDTVAGTGNGLAQSLTVYGRASGGQNAALGAYSDTVTVTVSY